MACCKKKVFDNSYEIFLADMIINEEVIPPSKASGMV